MSEFSTSTQVFGDVPSDLMALLFGAPFPAREQTAYAVSVDSLECPVVVPRKRRRLTGKRYRIARRRYAREMRAYRRGLIAPVRVRRLMPRAYPDVARLGDGSYAIRFELGRS